MSRTFKNFPYRKRNRSARMDHESKTSIKNKALNACYSETAMNDGLILTEAFRN